MIVWLVIILFCGGLSCLLNPPVLGGYRYTLHLTERSQVPVRIINIWIDQDFGSADLIAIGEAVNQWNYALNGYIVLKIVDTHFAMEVEKINQQIRDNGWLIIKIRSDQAGTDFIPKSADGFYCIGFTERIGGNHLYLIRDRLTNQDVMGVALHEMGHLLGAGHIVKGLMQPHHTLQSSQCIDQNSLIQVAEANRLLIDKLNWCVADTTN